MKRVADPARIVEQGGSGGGDRADHIEVSVQKSRRRQSFEEGYREKCGQKYKARQQRHQRAQGPVTCAPSGMGDRDQSKNGHPQQPRIEKCPRRQMVLRGQGKDRREDR